MAESGHQGLHPGSGAGAGFDEGDVVVRDLEGGAGGEGGGEGGG